ncbi:MAG TPA: hypothetical protein VJ885_16815 [Thermoanaerobaculia bacterium]|nr:hypothetical protein [Thermoanaerobaculia bacterium]
MLIDAFTGQRGWSPTFCGRPCALKERNNEKWQGKASYFLSTRRPATTVSSEASRSSIGSATRTTTSLTAIYVFTGYFIYFGQDVFFGVDPDSSEIEWDPVPALSRTSDFATRSWFLNDKWELNEH